MSQLQSTIDRMLNEAKERLKTQRKQLVDAKVSRSAAWLSTVDFRYVWTFRVACAGNLCFGKCSIFHCGLWDVQTINFLCKQYGMFKCT